MKTLVLSLSSAVRRAPWIVLAVTVAISLALGGLSSQFLPEEDSNASFAPEAPELTAADVIADDFGEQSSQSVMQVIVTDSGGDAISLGGLEATRAVAATVAGGSFAEILSSSPEQPAVVSYMFPVEQAIAMGAPEPTSDDEVKALFTESVAALPAEQSGFVTGLLPASADPTTASTEKGLMLVFTTGPETNDDLQVFTDQSAMAADEIESAEVGDGFTAEAFSFELLFADQDEFQNEILRILLAAVFIILAVLAAVFYVKPRPERRGLAIAGFAAIAIATALLVFDVLPVGIVALVFALTFLAWTFGARGLRRTTADTVVTIITIFFAISWMNGIGFLLFEDQSPMAQILPILLIGLGVDYSIHLTSRFREEVSEGATVDDGISRAIRTVGVALVLATVTTAVGFLTNIFNEIPALREFGALAAIGIAVSFVLMLTFVPAIRELLDRRAERGGTYEPERLRSGDSRILPRIAGSTSVLAKRVPAIVLVVSLVLGVVGAFGVTKLETKFSFLDFIPTTSPLRTTFETLVEDFGGGFGESTQVLIEGDVATADAWNAMALSSVNLADTPNVVLFGDVAAATSPISVILPLAQPDSPRFDESVGAAVGAAGLDPATLQVADGADVGAIYAAATAAAPDEVAGVLRASGSSWDGALFDITTQAGESGAGTLRDDVDEDFAPLEDAGATTVVTSDEIIGDVVVTSLRDSQVSSLLITLAAALLLLVANFWFEVRRPLLGVIATTPVILVVMWSLGLMALFGIPFGPVTATIAALAIGIGIPYMIHVTHRFLEDRARVATASEAIDSTLTHTGGALFGSAVTTIAGFGILMTSTTIPFQQFGLVTAYTILLALLASVLVLPSMLMLWDRWHRERGDALASVKPIDEPGDRVAAT